MTQPIDPLLSPEAEREKREHPFREVGVILLRDQEGRYLLIKTKKFPDYWQPLGGGKEPQDKTLINTVIRELNEEASLTLSAEDILPLIEVPYDFGKGNVQFFQATVSHDTHLSFNHEIVESRWITLREAVHLPMFNATRTCIEYLLREQERFKKVGD